MSEVTELLQDLLVKGATLSIDDGKLSVEAREGLLSRETVGALRRHKEEILGLLPELRFEAPLSVGQEGLWFIQKSAPDSSAYNIGFALRVESAQDQAPALRRALQTVANRHALLRATFPEVDGVPRQVVRAYRRVDLAEIDASGWSSEQLMTAASEAHLRPFDLEKEGAFRTCLFRRGPRESLLLLCMHHIAVDGWSLRMVVDEVLALLGADGRANPLPPIKRTYQQFATWQRTMLAERGEEMRRAWMAELAGVPLVLDLPTDRPRPPVQTFRGASLRRLLPPALADGLRSLARSQRATLYTIFLAAFQVLLHRYTGQESFCVGSVAASRERDELRDVFGYLLNMIALRAKISASEPPDFLSLLKETRERVLGALDLQEYPFPLLAKALLKERDPSRPPVCQVMFSYVRTQIVSEAALKLMDGAPVEVGGARLTSVALPDEISEADLLLEVTEQETRHEIGLRYNTDLFDAATIARMAGHLETLLAGIVADPGRPISELPLLTDEERRKLVVEWNRTEAPFSGESCIHHLFEVEVDRRPDAIALVDLCDPVNPGKAITYLELDRSANRVANRLRRLGAGPDKLIGVCLERGTDLIVALLGILKAGGAVVVLDPEHPRKRLARMLEDTNAELLLTRGSLLSALPETNARVIDFDEGFQDEPAERPRSGAGPRSLAYVLYTSGSTGEPNGVLIEHRGLVSSIEAHIRIMETGPETRHCHLLSFNFDGAFAHLFVMICAGGTVYLAPRDGDFLGTELIRTMEREAITHTLLVPSMLAAMPDAELPSLRSLVVAGEKCSAELVKRWGRARRMLNLYGPTETSILAAGARCLPDDRDPPIGRPIANMQAYVVDRSGLLAPPGVIGELWLGGVGVARGYLNRPELTARKFIENPFIKNDGRLYRTGDLVRYRMTDGEPPALEFVGRLDNQVKLRGYRIELSEVESALRALPQVRDAVATVVQGVEGQEASRRLVAYVTLSNPDDSKEGDLPAALRGELRKVLPAYLVPSAIVALPSLPLTLNGKVDLRALPPVDASSTRPSAAVEPRNEAERRIAQVWCSVLGLTRASVHDSFFEQGGHSLLAVTLMSRLSAELGQRLPVSTLFQAPTIEAMARRVLGSGPGGQEQSSFVIPLNPRGDRTPVFVVSALAMHGIYLHTLGRKLGEDQPSYLIELNEIAEAMADVTSMDVVIGRAADAVQRARPTGPYVLTGQSSGVRFALALAIELEARGQRTAFVNLDGSAPHAGRRSRGLPRGIVAGARVQNALLNGTLGIDFEHLKQLPEDDALRVVTASFERAGLLPPGIELEAVRRLTRVDERFERMVLDHVPPRPYSGRLVLLWAEDPWSDDIADLGLGTRVSKEGWSELAERPPETFTVPGNHFTLVREPYVGVVAEHLRRVAGETLTAEASAPDPFPVQWDTPEDAEAMWLLDEVHNLRQMRVLDFDLRLCPMIAGSNRAHERYGIPVKAEPRLIHAFVYQKMVFAEVPPADLANRTKEADQAVRRTATELGSRWENDWLPEIQSHLAALSAFDLRGASFPELLAHVSHLRGRLRSLWEIHFELLLPAILAISDFDDAYRDLFPEAGPFDGYDLLAGFPSKTLEANVRLWQLGRKAARTPSLHTLLTTADLAGLPAALAEAPEGRVLWGEIMDHVATYGERNDDLYIDAPTWIDDPTPVLRGLCEAAMRPERDLAAEHRQKAERREARLAELRALLASYPRAVVQEFEALLQAAQAGTVLSEDHHFWIDCKVTFHARRVCLEAGRRLVERQILDAADDVFDLTLAELSALKEAEPAAPGLRARLLERRAAAAPFAGARPPSSLGTMRPLPAVESAALKASFKFSGSSMMGPATQRGELRGMPGSRGKVTGPARVVRSLGDAAKLRPGEILVAPAILPSWTPFFATAAAVVTDTGGILSHAAVVAREYGIAAVVGAKGATAALRDGQIVEVDGDAGVVRTVLP